MGTIQATVTDSAIGTAKHRNIALVFCLQPNKRGSIEQWIMKFCEQAKERGHHVEVITIEGVLPEILSSLEQLGAHWRGLSELTKDPLAAYRTLGSFDVVHLNFVGLRERIAFMTYLALKPRIIWVDHISGPPGAPYRSVIKDLVNRLLLSRLSRVVCVSDFVRDRDRIRFPNSGKIRRIYNGVDTERFIPHRHEPAGTVKLLAAAHLIREKGLDVLLRGVAGITAFDWALTIAGAGPELDALQALSRELEIESRVSFVHLRNDLETLLDEHDVFVHPARWHEAFGLTIAEAMAAGVPVVASRIGGIPELIDHRETGMLVPPEDPQAIAAAVSELVTDRLLYARCARNARAKAVEQFSIDRCVSRHLALCEEVAA